MKYFSCPKRNSLLREADQCESYWKYFLDIFQLFAIWFFAFIRTLNPSHFRSKQSNPRRLKVPNETFIGKCLHFRYLGEVSLKTSGNTGPTYFSVSYVLLESFNWFAFQFATALVKNKLIYLEEKYIIYFNWNTVALFTFYRVSSSGKLKGVLVLLNVIIETDRIVKKVNETLVWVPS